MRTTINLDDELLQEARRRAVEQRVSLSEFISRAVRDSLDAPSVEEEPAFSMPTYGSETPGGVRHEPADFWSVLEGEDSRRTRR